MGKCDVLSRVRGKRIPRAGARLALGLAAALGLLGCADDDVLPSGRGWAVAARGVRDNSYPPITDKLWFTEVIDTGREGTEEVDDTSEGWGFFCAQDHGIVGSEDEDNRLPKLRLVNRALYGTSARLGLSLLIIEKTDESSMRAGSPNVAALVENSTWFNGVCPVSWEVVRQDPYEATVVARDCPLVTERWDNIDGKIFYAEFHVKNCTKLD
jgi:hypothetical protein